jgi:hypothetical protein
LAGADLSATNEKKKKRMGNHGNANEKKKAEKQNKGERT